MAKSLFCVVVLCTAFWLSEAFLPVAKIPIKTNYWNALPIEKDRLQLRNVLTMKLAEEESTQVDKKLDAEAITKKYGLEAGLFTAFTSKDKSGVDAKTLLAKYGSAYLVTSITLSIISFAICYVLVDAGIDVSTLLAKIGIIADSKTETAGTAALAYAAHKAASPIRFPPTVALTPLTAKYLFNRNDEAESKEKEESETNAD